MKTKTLTFIIAQFIIVSTGLSGGYYMGGAKQSAGGGGGGSWVSTATDDFNRADGDLGANWTYFNAQHSTVTSNTLAGKSGGGDHGAFWVGTGTFNAPQAAQLDYTTTSATEYVGVTVRSTANQGYGAYVTTTDSYIFRIDPGGAWFQLGTGEAGFALNDKIRLEVEGSTISFYGGAAGTTLIDTRSDATYSSGGTPGTWYYEGTTARGDNFIGYTK